MNSFLINGTRIEVWRDLAEISERASELLIGVARESASEKGRFTVALSGGSTPKALYGLLATEAKSSRSPWEATHVFWTDERCVPPTDSESNYRMAHEALLAHVNVPAEQVHRMRGEDDPQQAAKSYAAELEKSFGPGDPRFSLILLGMGDDGHIASLFPSSPALADKTHTVAANYVEKLPTPRLTMTLRTLNAAETVIFLISGPTKAKALLAVFDSKAKNDSSIPARLIKPNKGELIWLIDEAAAELVSERF
jgi:6-phosphogluconolactonase